MGNIPVRILPCGSEMAEALEFDCAHCDRRFASLRGLRDHQHRAHRPEYDLEVLERRCPEVKVRWSKEEVLLLARKELELERQNV